MPIDSSLNELLACPRCDKSPLSTKDACYYCAACKVRFPFIGEIPWLFAEPDASLAEWRNRLHFEIQSFTHDAQRIGQELKE